MGEFNANPNRQSIEPRVFEVREFMRFRPSESLIPVKHYRTIYHRDGRISQEALSVEFLLEQTIRAFHGNADQAAGVLTGLFAEPRDAEECAQAIARHHGRNAEVRGTRVTVAV